MRVDLHRKHDALYFFIACVAHLVVHVAVDGIWDPGTDEFDEVAVVDCTVDLILVEERE